MQAKGQKYKFKKEIKIFNNYYDKCRKVKEQRNIL